MAKKPSEAVLQTFLQRPPDVLLRELRLRGPAPISPERRNEIVRALPRDGELKEISASQRKKVASIRGILGVHDRESVYLVKVIQVPQAIVALHARSILLISEPGLAIWSAEELQALVAHEVGHEYVWEKYYDARAGNRQEELQQLELFCDGVSILTLAAVGVDPSNLTSGLEKSICYNRSRLGMAKNENSYPNFRRRARFHRALIQWIAKWRAQSETTN